MRLTMLCLSGFELYFRWVPLIEFSQRLDKKFTSLVKHFLLIPFHSVHFDSLE